MRQAWAGPRALTSHPQPFACQWRTRHLPVCGCQRPESTAERISGDAAASGDDWGGVSGIHDFVKGESVILSASLLYSDSVPGTLMDRSAKPAAGRARGVNGGCRSSAVVSCVADGASVASDGAFSVLHSLSGASSDRGED
jgi:hypothetical protein